MQLQIDAHEHASKSKDKYGFAATLINAGARGFFGRLLGKEQRLQSWGALKIQCAYRGMIGRIRAEEERWRKVRVAPTKYALNIVRLRSKITMDRGDWVELLDPFTNTFWYLNRPEHALDVDAAAEFEKDLFCMWDPWPHPYGASPRATSRAAWSSRPWTSTRTTGSTATIGPAPRASSRTAASCSRSAVCAATASTA